MKLRSTLLGILLCITSLTAFPTITSAQETRVNFEPLMNNEFVTVVYLSPTMLENTNLRFTGEDMPSSIPLQKLIHSVSSIYIFSATEETGMAAIRKVFAPAINTKNKIYEQLFFIKERGKTMRFISQINPDEDSFLYLIVEDPKEYVALSFLGTFTNEQIKRAMHNSKTAHRPSPLLQSE